MKLLQQPHNKQTMRKLNALVQRIRQMG